MEANTGAFALDISRLTDMVAFMYIWARTAPKPPRITPGTMKIGEKIRIETSWAKMLPDMSRRAIRVKFIGPSTV